MESMDLCSAMEFVIYAFLDRADLDKGKTLSEGLIYLRFWLLSYEAMISCLSIGAIRTPPIKPWSCRGQFVEAKRTYLAKGGHSEVP